MRRPGALVNHSNSVCFAVAPKPLRGATEPKTPRLRRAQANSYLALFGRNRLRRQSSDDRGQADMVTR